MQGMEALVQYDSSDSDEFGPMYESQSQRLTLNSGVKCSGEEASSARVDILTEGDAEAFSEVNPVFISSDSSEIVDSESKVNSDYFGILSSESDDSAEFSESQNKIHVGDCEIELPQSEFWNEMTRDRNDAGGSTITPAVSDETLANTDSKNKSRVMKRNMSYQRSENHLSNNKMIRREHSQLATEYLSKKTSNKLMSESKTEQREELRPLYHIHSKIAPNLQSHRKRESRVPRKVQISLPGHSGLVNRVKWCSPNYSHLLLSASMDRTVKVWNCWSQLEPCVRTLFCHNKAVKDAEWDDTGRNILSSSFDKTAALCDVEKGKMVRSFTAPGYVTCGKFHPVHSNLAVMGSESCVLCWDIRAAGRAVKTFSHKDRFGQVQDLVMTRDGQQVFASCDLVSRDSADRNIIAWDFPSCVVLSNQIFQEKYVCNRLKLHPTEGTLLAQTHGNYVAIFSTDRPYKMNKYRRFDGHKMMGYNIGFDVSPDGRLVTSGSGEGQIYFYLYHTGKKVCLLDTGWNICLDVAFHPVLSTTLACCSWDGQIAVWT